MQDPEAAGVPDRCYSDIELRNALVANYFKAQDGVSIPSITSKSGPSKPTLWRQAQRFDAVLELAGWAPPATPTREDVLAVAAAIDFPHCGRTTFFLPDEERLLLEMAAMHAEHGHGKGKRLTLNYAKRALAHMAENEEDPALKQRLGGAKLSRKWLMDARTRVAEKELMLGGKDPYKDVKSANLSQTRAAAKKPGQNAAMFAQMQVRAHARRSPPSVPARPARLARSARRARPARRARRRRPSTTSSAKLASCPAASAPTATSSRRLTSRTTATRWASSPTASAGSRCWRAATPT